MRATLLGSGTALPSTRRGSPGIVVSGEDFTILVDAGSGTLQRLAHANVSLIDLDVIAVTHFHPDHVGDLVSILFALQNPGFDATRRWPVLLGPTGFGEFYERLRAPFGSWLPEAGREISLLEWSGEQVAGSSLGRGSFFVDAVRTVHTENSLAYSISQGDGRRVVCSGDTEECSNVTEFAKDADLLFLECSFPVGHEVPRHLHPEAVSRIARACGAKRIVLTHFYPECDRVDLHGQLAEDVKSRIELGADGVVYTLT